MTLLPCSMTLRYPATCAATPRTHSRSASPSTPLTPPPTTVPLREAPRRLFARRVAPLRAEQRAPLHTTSAVARGAMSRCASRQGSRLFA
eukprot:1175368-Rhodomonas_salina.2